MASNPDLATSQAAPKECMAESEAGMSITSNVVLNRCFSSIDDPTLLFHSGALLVRIGLEGILYYIIRMKEPPK